MSTPPETLTPDPAPPPSPTAPRALGGYQPGLDGMRAVGMATMLAFHAEFAWARGAFLALSQFFTLSGFLVTTVLLHAQERRGAIDLRTFWGRRIRRLMPAAMVALAGIVVFGATVATRSQAEVLPRQVTAAAANVANWLFIAEDTSYVHQFASPSPVQHFWSLSVEEQFYLVVPLSLFVVFKLTRSRHVLALTYGVGAVISAGWMAFLYHSGASIDRVYYGTDTRMAEMLTGVVLAVVLSRRGLAVGIRQRAVLAWAGFGAYVLTLWGFGNLRLTDGAMWSGGSLVFSMMTCLVIVGILAGTGPLRILGWGPLAAMGRITYGIYLYHLPIFLWLTSARTGLDQWPLFGLRLAVTFAAAIASYHLIELPIRNGTFLVSRTGRPRFRLAMLPVAAVLIVIAAHLTTDRNASDPFATLRASEATDPPPAAVTDPTLDVLVINDANGEAIADRLTSMAADDDSLTVTRGGGVACDRVVATPDGRTCNSWFQTWPELIQDADPDVVLFYVDDWPAADLRRLAGDSGEAPYALGEELLTTGFDLLTSEGAPVLWVSTGARITVSGELQGEAFRDTMREILQARPDVRVARSLSSTDDVTDEAFVSESTATIVDELEVNRRRSDASVPRVMVVGDSQARSLGEGLAHVASESGDAVVWNVAAPGCGIVNTGRIIDLVTDEESVPDESCAGAIEAWGSNVEQFDPDLVIVLSSLRDVQDRRLPGWDGFRTIGDPEVDDLLLDSYIDAVDTLSSGGATVVWMEAPCVRYVSPFGGSAPQPRAFDPSRIVHLDDVILPQLVEARPDVVRTFDLDAVLCPEGEFAEDLGGVDDIRPDGIHLSLEGARWLGEIVEREVVKP